MGCRRVALATTGNKATRPRRRDRRRRRPLRRRLPAPPGCVLPELPAPKRQRPRVDAFPPGESLGRQPTPRPAPNPPCPRRSALASHRCHPMYAGVEDVSATRFTERIRTIILRCRVSCDVDLRGDFPTSPVAGPTCVRCPSDDRHPGAGATLARRVASTGFRPESGCKELQGVACQVAPRRAMGPSGIRPSIWEMGISLRKMPAGRRRTAACSRAATSCVQGPSSMRIDGLPSHSRPPPGTKEDNGYPGAGFAASSRTRRRFPCHRGSVHLNG